jgi:hypothetical protein
MTAVLAQSDAILNAIMQTGAYGLICAWLMWRDSKQAERAHEHEMKREARHEETQKEIRLQRQSIDDLVRMMGIEVLSRPHVAQRAAQDAQQIIEAVKARNA